MSTELVTTPIAGALAPTDAAPLFDLDSIPADKLIIPRLNVLQSNSKAVQDLGHVVGTFHNNVTNENYGSQVRLIPVKMSFGAVYMTVDEGLKCRSTDGITSMYGELCQQCPFGVYHGGDWKNGEPPECSATIDMLCVEATSLQPMLLTFRNTSYKEGRRIVTNLRMVNRARTMVIGTEKEKNAKGTFYVLKLQALNPPTEAEYATATEWKQSLSTKAFDVVDEA